MWLTKAETGRWRTLGGDALVQLTVDESHTCYLGERGELHAVGYGCETCPACELRARGWDLWRAIDGRGRAGVSYAVRSCT
jgi:7-cyano-7-deazaguanine synthase